MHPALSWRTSLVRTRFALEINARLYDITLLVLTGIGFALRLGLLTTYPLREDEAIYGYWARAATLDPFFLHIWPDKPPIFIWLLTGAFALFGPSQATARLVSIFASTLTLPLIAIGAQHLWHSRTAALLAALLLMLNPFAVSFASTAYTDSLLVLLGSGAMVLALHEQGRERKGLGRSVGVGFLVGAACMTKQQGLLYVPLIIALLWIKPQPWRQRWFTFAWALLGAALIALPILWWDSQRWAVAPSSWEMAQRTYSPLTWLPLQQWLAHGQAWSAWLWYLGGSWTVWTMLGVATGVTVGMAWRRPRLLLIVGWGFGFLLVHLLTTVQVWDRYLLPLAPWLALVASGPLTFVTHARLPEWSRGMLLLLLVVAVAELVPPSLEAARGQIPIGGDHGDYTGLTDAIVWVEGQGDNPEYSPAILYHQVLGWHFRFYLYEEVQPKGDRPPRFDLRWFPSAAYLADNAAKSAYPPKYLIVPDWATPRDLALQLAFRGLSLEPRLRVGRFAVMEIVQPPRPPCQWCKSSLPAKSSAKIELPFAPYHPILPAVPQMSLSPTP